MTKRLLAFGAIILAGLAAPVRAQVSHFTLVGAYGLLQMRSTGTMPASGVPTADTRRGNAIQIGRASCRERVYCVV